MKIVLLLALFCDVSVAQTLKDQTSASGSLKDLLKPQQLIILTPSYQGKAKLVYQRGPRDNDSSKERDLHFTAFTSDSSNYSETDCPQPKLPAIFEAKPMEGGGYETGAFAYSEEAPSVETLSDCKTFKELKKIVPGLTQISEGPEPLSYWFNWFELSEDGQLSVILLSVVRGADETLKSVEIWSGTLPPVK